MPRDGSGNYALPAGNPVVTGTVISSSGWANPTLADIAAALTQSLSRDGQTTPTNNLPMGNFRHLNCSDGQNRNEYATLGQVQDQKTLTLSNVTGTDIITATVTPGFPAYAAGQFFTGIAAGPNTTTAVTLNINGLGAKSVTKYGSAALAVGDIISAFVVFYDGTRFQLLNPNPLNPPAGNQTINGNSGVSGNASVGGTLTVGSAGAFTGAVSAANFTATSDETLKTDWRPLPPDFIDRLAGIRRYGTFAFLKTGVRHAGVGAQSLQGLLPEAVVEGLDGTLSVAYGNAALVACIEMARELVRLRALLEPVK